MSLMAGLLISSLSVLASISAYQNLKSAAASTEIGLTHDGQIAAALIAVEKYITQAGYGITDAGTNDITVVTVPATSATASTTSLLWRYHDGTSIVCRGLRESSELIQNKTYRMLKIIGSPDDCDISTDLTTLVWDDVISVLGQWMITTDLANYIGTNQTFINFQLTQLTCSPYGYGVPDTHLSVRVSMPGKAELNGAVMTNANETHICLSNMYPT